MKGPIGFYLDTVDTSAFVNAAADSNSKYEAPMLPLFAPWLVAGPILYLIKDQSRASLYVFAMTIMLSVGGYAATMVYYLRAKDRYRETLGIPGWREKMRQKIADDMTKLD